MLFNSLPFIFAFLPITLTAYILIKLNLGAAAAYNWLIIASLFFYSYWNPVYLPLLLFLIFFNFLCGQRITTASPMTQTARRWTALGIIGNLLALGFFKYSDLAIDTTNAVSGANWPLLHMALPLAISFFTFQKIAFLIDCYRGLAKAGSLRDYMLFVSFFPQLIAGPIVHYQEIMPQFKKNALPPTNPEMIAAGLTLFFIGLFKKSVLADLAAMPANTVFEAAEIAGSALSVYDAWIGALTYSLQIYFDFSGYSDMAIGTALMFGIRLPENFQSPYKATGLIDFWQRWHMTLSRFLRDYLYIPLGGNRMGSARQAINIMITMLLGGLWHGAAWTFVLWGGLHGILIVLNHLLRGVATNIPDIKSVIAKRLWRGLCLLITFFIVTTLWVFFRANSLESAFVMLRGMSGLTGYAGSLFQNDIRYLVFVLALMIVIWFFPNSMNIIFKGGITRNWQKYLLWYPSIPWIIAASFLALSGLLLMQSHLGKIFIYFDF